MEWEGTPCEAGLPAPIREAATSLDVFPQGEKLWGPGGLIAGDPRQAVDGGKSRLFDFKSRDKSQAEGVSFYSFSQTYPVYSAIFEPCYLNVLHEWLPIVGVIWFDRGFFRSYRKTSVERSGRCYCARREMCHKSWVGRRGLTGQWKQNLLAVQDKYLNHLIDKMSRLRCHRHFEHKSSEAQNLRIGKLGARSEWKYMLPFDLDLASSGFTDETGERTDEWLFRAESWWRGMSWFNLRFHHPASFDRISVSDLCARNPHAAQKFLKARVFGDFFEEVGRSIAREIGRKFPASLGKEYRPFGVLQWGVWPDRFLRMDKNNLCSKLPWVYRLLTIAHDIYHKQYPKWKHEQTQMINV